MQRLEIHIIRAVLHALSSSGAARLPGFGELKVRSESRPDEGNQIQPPRRSMIFTEEMLKDDNISAFFVDKLGYDAQEARKMVYGYFEDFRQKVNQEAQEWQGLGKFFKDDSGTIHFAAADQWINFINPGLQAVEKPRKEDKQVAAAVAATYANEESRTGDEPIKDTQASRGMAYSWVWIVASILAFSLCLLWIIQSQFLNTDASAEQDRVSSEEYSSLEERQEDSVQASFIPVHDVDPAEPAESKPPEQEQSDEHREELRGTEREKSNDKNEDSEKETKSVEKPVETPKEVKEEPKPSVGPQCVVVAGAFSQESNAQAFRKRLQTNYSNVYYKKHGSLTRVGVQVSCDEMSSTKRSLKKEMNLDSWSFRL